MKEKVFIVFTDLDGTFRPITSETRRNFVNLMKNISEKEKIAVKFCPISGRPADYVAGVMDLLKDEFREAGLNNVVEYGAGEQGGVIVNSTKAYEQNFLGYESSKQLKKEILQTIENSRFSKYIADEPGKRYSCSLHIKAEYESKLTKEQQNDLYNKLRVHIEDKLGQRVSMARASDCLEVMPPEVSKHNAINTLMQHYNRKYEIVGITYSGDAENDKKAIQYVSKLAEIPGVKAHVFLPSNCNSCIESSQIEGWKEKLIKVGSKNRIEKGKSERFDGVLELMTEKFKNGELVGKGMQKWQTCDDFEINRKKIMLEKIQKWASKDDCNIKKVGITRNF